MNQLIRILLTVIIGLFSGVIGGATGIGGAFIIPAFYGLNIISNYSTCIGTSIFAMVFPISFFSVLQYAKHNDIDYKIGLALTVSYAIFSYVGTRITYYLQDRHLMHVIKYATAFILIICGVYVGYDAHNNKIINTE
jgi:uncharacterized membrane protein YfcA